MAQTNMHEAAAALSDWVTTWGLTVSAPKSTHMCFTLKHLPSSPITSLCGQGVPYSRTHTFLGLHLDGPRLSWARHIDHLRTAYNKRLDILKKIAEVRWGANSDLLRYYLATIRPKLMYGSSIYRSAACSLLNKLDLIQNAALRISLGAMKSSPLKRDFVPALPPHSELTPVSSPRYPLFHLWGGPMHSCMAPWSMTTPPCQSPTNPQHPGLTTTTSTVH
ncbi:RNA-directed DNA polymerase from mobile element jockey [Portunus trituberculatus]|uniref:RNA-directed DNA polymerase from mobile element jockey n=1 Tax=Portunus trituberculatus TaxID=210409 RepID=A0A5B7K860_PORTR|nr:RNA-directed DNA polymerase from mobile element jockey [Portunus trituberculatus]